MAIKSQVQRGLLFGVVASISCCGLLGIYCLLVGQMGQFEERVLGSTATVFAASVLALVSVMPWEKRRWHPIGPIGVATVAMALVLLLIFIWVDLPWQSPLTEKLADATGVACVLSLGLPHIGLLSLANLRKQYGWVRRVTVVVTLLLAATITGTILDDYLRTDLAMRIIGILAIGMMCGTITVPILHGVSIIRLRESVRTVELTLSMTCPRCDKTQSISVGRSRCVSCGLKFKIEIEEDNCTECGYSLYRLESSVCPECGASIAISNQANEAPEAP